MLPKSSMRQKTQFYLKDPSVGKTHTLYEKHASSIATMSMKHKKPWYFESDWIILILPIQFQFALQLNYLHITVTRYFSF